MEKTKAYNQMVGEFGEELAARVLRERGYQIIERNWHSRLGEIDIIARKDQLLVVVEVKTRTSERHGTPVAAVTVKKAARLRRLFRQWLSEHPQYPGTLLRIDVVGINLTSHPYQVQLLEGAA